MTFLAALPPGGSLAGLEAFISSPPSSPPLAPEGTDFQRKVWDAMCAIPYGETRAYGDLADDLSSSARAVGTACGRNPIPVIVPCHRVIGKSGALTGYTGAGGLATKQFLLVLEKGTTQGVLAL